MEYWVLTIFLLVPDPRVPAGSFHAGEYFDEGRCEISKAMQMPYWRKVYGQTVRGECSLAAIEGTTIRIK